MTASEVQPLIDSGERFLDELERGDVEAAIAAVVPFCHPEIRFTSAIGHELDGRTYVGTGGLREWFQEFSDTFDVRYEDRRFQTSGDDVVVGLLTMKLRGKGSGAEVIREIGTVWELRDGLMVNCVTYASQGEALQAAEALHA
jgi:ketosteroid isomerase-like protein